mmetsp:Transcript_111903/g.256573  ORF Transcript_111903/g.256573 Transcript_111903/m.256573 type:complete len:433 (+) Transcript_111903:101-1399(+)
MALRRSERLEELEPEAAPAQASTSMWQSIKNGASSAFQSMSQGTSAAAGAASSRVAPAAKAAQRGAQRAAGAAQRGAQRTAGAVRSGAGHAADTVQGALGRKHQEEEDLEPMPPPPPEPEWSDEEDADENTPLWQRGPLGPHRGGKLLQPKLLALAILPFIVFVLVSCSFLFLSHHLRYYIWALAVCAVVLALAYVVSASYGSKRARSKPGMSLIVLCCVATISGAMVGTRGYDMYMHAFNEYSDRQVYHSVPTAKTSDAFKDAGVLTFIDEAQVQLTMAVGYRASHLFCVAPVMTPEMSPNVTFWVVGEDCCDKRANMRCDDVQSENAHTGVVMFPNLDPFKWDLHRYRAAAEMAAAQHGLHIPENVMFMRWVEDPNVYISSLLDKAVFYWGMWCIGYFMVSLMVAFVVHRIIGIRLAKDGSYDQKTNTQV